MGILSLRASATALCSRLMSTTNIAAGILSIARMPSKYLCSRAAFAADDRLLLLDVIVERAVRFHLLDFLEPLDGRLIVLKFVSVPPSQRSVTKNWPHSLAVSLTHCCACFLVPTNTTLPPLRTFRTKIARGFELRERLAEVNDVNAVARVEDERLHLGVPTLRLVSEMDARFQQFFNADA
jgi:hypothetical protein